MKKLVSILLCFTLFIGIMPMSYAARDTSFEKVLAEDLKQLGLFYGVSETNFDLDRAPTRVEALVMLIRVLGREKTALNGTWVHPFTDVPAWADKYVGYGYQMGLANGIGLTTFGTGRANAAMYITFVLRALGYSDANGEFTWDNPFELAKDIGVLTNGVDTANFWRADVVLVSYAALNTEVKDSNKKLADNLIGAGVFTSDAYNACYDKDAIARRYPDRIEKSSEEIYKNCKDAVFYIEVYDNNKKAIGSGSGFFIDADGTAVTNYHVIEGASIAYIQLADEETVYEVSGVLHYSKENDWAVIKVNGSGFSYLPVSKDTLVTGSTVYALGSPLGLQNTFSQGIISNPKRELDGTPYIQITTPISSGSSGGALLNKYGDVIGITSAAFDDGQNLNLAVPITIVDMSKTSYVMSLTEMMNITGMFDSGLGNGSGSGGTGSRQKQAFDAFKTFISKNTNWEYKYPAYSKVFTYNGGREEYVAVYDTDLNTIYLMVVYDCTEKHERQYTLTMLTSIDSITQHTYMTYEYEDHGYGRYGGYSNYTGESNFSPQLIKSNVSIGMEQIDGSMWLSAAEIEEHENLAGTAFVAIMEWADDTLKAATSGAYNIADFGFINLYN